MGAVTVEPVVTIGDRGEETYSHPAYAQMSVRRTSGQTALYGSEFKHQHYITVSICSSTLHRSLSNDWPMGGKELVSVSMSESQWSSLVSSAGVGSGVPVTLGRFNGEMIPGLPDPQSKRAKFEGEAKAKLEKVAESLKEMREHVRTIGLSKAKEEQLLKRISTAEMNLGANLGFVMEMFGEHMENVVQAAKAEVNAYVGHTLAVAGREALADGAQKMLQIGPSDEA